MKVIGLHGFNVRDQGLRSIQPTLDALRVYGHETHLMSYGYVGLFKVRLAFKHTVQRLLDAAPQWVLAHSNAVPIAAEACAQGLKLRGLIAYQPAHNPRFQWPENAGRVLVLYNSGDYAVLGGKMWRMANPISWFVPHYWGDAGRKGYREPRHGVIQRDSSPFRGHSYLNRADAVEHFVPMIHRFIVLEDLQCPRPLWL